MLGIRDAKAIYIYPGPTDMRYGIPGLCSLISDIRENEIHVFCSSDRRSLKMIIVEEGCISLLHRRLTVGRYSYPSKGDVAAVGYPQLLQLIDSMMTIARIENNGRIPAKRI